MTISERKSGVLLLDELGSAGVAAFPTGPSLPEGRVSANR
jgi:hypothetical protein